jgi:hypothetical protein
LEILDLPATIRRTLTEDLPIGDRAAQTGLRVLTRRAVRPPNPIDGGLCELWRFARRQCQLIRLYRRRLWWFAAFLVTTDLAVRIGLLTTITALPKASAATVVIAVLGSAATEIRLAIGRKLEVRDPVAFRVSQHLLAWMIVPVPLFRASVIWGAIITSPGVWRHVRYRVDRLGRVIGVVRRRYASN